MENDVQTPITESQDSDGPKTREEARFYHIGVLAGLTVYAREVGASTLKNENELLRRLMMEQGLKTLREFKRLPKSDWRIGLSCKPKSRLHALHYEMGKILQVHPNGFGNVVSKDGVLLIQMESGRTFLASADDWVTA